MSGTCDVNEATNGLGRWAPVPWLPPTAVGLIKGGVVHALWCSRRNRQTAANTAPTTVCCNKKHITMILVIIKCFRPYPTKFFTAMQRMRNFAKKLWPQTPEFTGWLFSFSLQVFLWKNCTPMPHCYLRAWLLWQKWQIV